jgi:S-ribosylhomocysteine lyase LuxS involved in autoinducer biosynthesis
MHTLSVRCNIVTRIVKKQVKGVRITSFLVKLCLPNRKFTTAGTSNDTCQAHGQTNKLGECVLVR